jgi:hypothetical protein
VCGAKKNRRIQCGVQKKTGGYRGVGKKITGGCSVLCKSNSKVSLLYQVRVLFAKMGCQGRIDFTW